MAHAVGERDQASDHQTLCERSDKTCQRWQEHRSRKEKACVGAGRIDKALQKDKSTEKIFNSLTPGRQREYAEYISEAKREEIKQSRIAKILPLIKAGIGLNDKYR